jgi:putative N-acetylmannosamine-6-phosphate epimerase
MEHRCSDRYTADIKILIHKYQLPVAIGRIKNGSRYGLFIESDMVDVQPLQQLGIEILAYPSAQKLQRYKFDSIVIHTTEHGFGIELDALDDEEEGQLLRLLRDAPVTPQESELYAMVANA